MTKSFLATLRYDLPAAIVVYLVAIPLCLGIAMASGAPPIGGLIAGIVGGIVVGALSGSQLGVSGPAAGLTVIVLNAITDLGGYETMLAAVLLAGIFQIVMGLLRAGVLAYYFPSSVIKGMLSGIGIIIILKQIPHAVGYDRDFEGDLSFAQLGGQNTFSALWEMLDFISWGSVVTTTAALAIMLLWERPFIKNSKLKLVPGPLVAVVVGIVLGIIFEKSRVLAIAPSLFVQIPDLSAGSVFDVLAVPKLSALSSTAVWKAGLTIAIVASIETLLCVEATDKLDPFKRVTPTNRELFAQGIGNSISGLLGGLPVTQVIVRSSANIQSGGRTKLAAVLHGFMLLISLLVFPHILRLISLSTLAAILFIVGYKLAKPSLFREMFRAGSYQFIPFAVTIVGVVFTDLLTGVLIGMGVGVFYILYNNYRVPFHFDLERHEDGKPIRIELSEDVSFLNKASILRTLNALPTGAHVYIDATRTVKLDPDVVEIINDAVTRAPQQGTIIELIGFEDAKKGRVAESKHLTAKLNDAAARNRSTQELDLQRPP